MRIHYFPAKRREEGHALTEMALTLPIVLLLVMGILDFGRITFLYSQVSNAAREGSRYGSVTGPGENVTLPQFVDCAAIRDEVTSKFGMLLDIADEDIDITYDNGDSDSPYGFDCNNTSPNPDQLQIGDRIRVRVNSTFTFITPLVSAFITEVPVEFSSARTIVIGGVQIPEGSY